MDAGQPDDLVRLLRLPGIGGAIRRRSIRIGTGVSVAGTRIAPVTAHSIATINRLAPGRTFLGIGTGNTAQRIMGQPPIRYAEFEEYCRVLRGLLDGEEVEFTYRGRTRALRFDMAELGFIDIENHIDFYISGFYPRTHRLAGRYGDGLVCSVPPHQGFTERALGNVKIGADQAGRELPSAFPVASLTAAIVLEPGEAMDSPRVIDAVGPFAIASVHYIYDKIKERGGEPPPHMRPFWNEYCALVEQTPESHRHLRVHAGHCTTMHPDEVRFVTPDLIRATCLAGTADEVLEQVRGLADEGLGQIIILPSLSAQYRNIEEFSKKVMMRL